MCAGSAITRLGIAGAERAGALDQRDEIGIGGRRAHGAVDHEAIRAAGDLHVGARRRFEKGAQRRERVLAQRHARGHGVTAALGEQAFGDGAAHRAADIDAEDRAAGAGADAAGLKRDRESRPAEFFLQPRGDEADNARMPALGGGDHDRAALLQAERGHRLGLGLRHGLDFDRLTLAIEAVELGGDARRLDRIVLDQEPHAEIGAADASAGIDARAEQKAEMPRLRRAGEPRDIHQAHMARRARAGAARSNPWRQRRG